MPTIPPALWLEEFATPYRTFRDAGAVITVVSPQGGAVPIDPRSEPSSAQAAAWRSALGTLDRTERLAPDHGAGAHDMLFVPGGHGAMIDLATDPEVARLVSEFARADKLIGAVCHGPAALVQATHADGTPLVAGKQVTSFTDSEEVAAELDGAIPFSLQQRLIDLGATFRAGGDFTDHVERDGRLITGQNPQSSASIAQAMLAALTAARATKDR